jgi:hypothetical protein
MESILPKKVNSQKSRDEKQFPKHRKAHFQNIFFWGSFFPASPETLTLIHQ